MAHLNKVVQSVNAPDGVRCLDVFVAPEGGFGFSEYRRDPEDDRGWQPTGAESRPVWPSAEEALRAACLAVLWLPDALE